MCTTLPIMSPCLHISSCYDRECHLHQCVLVIKLHFLTSIKNHSFINPTHFKILKTIFIISSHKNCISTPKENKAA